MLRMASVILQQMHTPLRNVVLMEHFDYSVVCDWQHLLQTVMSALTLCYAIMRLHHQVRIQQLRVAANLHNAQTYAACTGSIQVLPAG